MTLMNPQFFLRRDFLLGTLLALVLAVVSVSLATNDWLAQNGISALTLAIVIGMVIGNTVFPSIAGHCGAGVDFARTRLLRLGIILFGFRITFQDIALVGWSGVVIGALIVGLTFILAVQVGTRLLRMDSQTSMLIGAGAAICGAAAVIAVEPIVRAKAEKVTVAVATVVVFGTIAMFLYPFLFPLASMSEHEFGIYIGSTVHEVAQVVVAGSAVSDTAAAPAVIEKMIRVMMLAPFLLILSAFVARKEAGTGKSGILIPWFAVLFIVAAGINSTNWLPAGLVKFIVELDVILLAMAMSALGLRTRFSAMRAAGVQPILLASILFIFLIFGGYLINKTVIGILG